MPRCPKCKNSVKETDRFCARCGYSPFAKPEPPRPEVVYVQTARPTLEPKHPAVRILLTVGLVLVALFLCANSLNPDVIQVFRWLSGR